MYYDEIWKDILGYEGLYQISNFGNVKSFRRKKVAFLTKNKDTNGYYIVKLCGHGMQKTRKVHQLVAIAFLNHIPCGMKMVVNHIDLNKTNNNVNNLEIITNRENSNRKHLKSTSKYIGVSWNKRKKLWHSKIQINKVSKHLGYFSDEKEASEAYQNELLTIKN